MSEVAVATVRTDAFLSDVLARDVFVVGVDVSERELVMRQSKAAPGTFMYAKVPGSDIERLRWFTDMGFRLMDVGVTLDKALVEGQAAEAAGYVLREAAPGDQAAVVDLAGESFVYTRFHRDEAFVKKEADAVKRRWTENFFRGTRGDFMVVAERDGTVAGFVLCLKKKSGELVIDLITVSENHRRKGLASAMVAKAESLRPGVTSLVVGTQLVNIPSLRAYEGMGFRIREADYVLHWHK